ncbi:MAG: acetyl-CoA carboxylase biotin carboxylase subunit [Candidatus Zixiibacteriota bacterium]
MAARINKILIANRGEIAVRIIRACREMGIRSVAVFSDADATAYHVRMADEAYRVGPAPSNESYLVHDNIIAAARKSGADAIHPGYGFLAENAQFAQRCIDEGLTFIGPEPKTIALLGDKIQARAAAQKAGLPIVPGVQIDDLDSDGAYVRANDIGFPVLVKAAAGGGGKGMRVVEAADKFAEAIERASSEAESAFGDSRIYVEKFLRRSRHIEFQILCDMHSNCVHLGERECSIQRRHQKLIEESPSPVMTTELREQMGSAAVRIAQETGYVGAGTVEFMYDTESGSYYFLEVNTRLQVEHPVTELVTGLDLVQQQIRIAEGQKLDLTQTDVTITGHAIECRICAEDSNEQFMPSTGRLNHYRMPAGPGVRVDSGVVIFSEISVYYDPLIAKLIVWGVDRADAISRMRRALDEYRVAGVCTTTGFHRTVMDNPAFLDGDLSTQFIAEQYPDGEVVSIDESLAETAALAAAIESLSNEQKLAVAQSSRRALDSLGWVQFHRKDALKRFEGNR